MDEPFSALDPLMVEELHADVLRIWNVTKKTIVLVSHHFEEAVLLADRIGVMRDGRLEEVIDIDLPRPRSENQENFGREMRRLKACASGTAAGSRKTLRKSAG